MDLQKVQNDRYKQTLSSTSRCESRLVTVALHLLQIHDNLCIDDNQECCIVLRTPCLTGERDQGEQETQAGVPPHLSSSCLSLALLCEFPEQL